MARHELRRRGRAVLWRVQGVSMRTLARPGRRGHGAFLALRGSSPTKAGIGVTRGARGSRGTRSARLEER